MTHLSNDVLARAGSLTDWDATYGSNVKVLNEGIINASVCTALDDPATDAAMSVRPTGTRHGWIRSMETPTPCLEDPARRHVLYEA